MSINIEKSFKTFLKNTHTNQISLKYNSSLKIYSNSGNHFEILSDGELGLAYIAFSILPAKKEIRPAFTPKFIA